MSSADKTSGGAVALIRPVTDFYARVLSSPRLAHHFEDAAMEALIAKQAAFISATLNGDTRYAAEDFGASSRSALGHRHRFRRTDRPPQIEP
ncbi:MAG: hypothetical protein H0T94_12385 [Acidimicrobiia bacterium]|nr:hypothetical protein [Acidimicrobiia bacterium]MDQ3501098.1 hypothetical protein [Actinomycetota bacterium]